MSGSLQRSRPIQNGGLHVRRLASLAAPVALFLVAQASSATAGTITVEFDLSNSAISILGGALTIPPDGSITSASATVVVQGSNATSPSAGAASLKALTIAATINGTVGGAVSLTGNLSGNQIGTAAGSLTGGLGNLLMGTLTLSLNGNVNCFGGLCGVLGTFPVSLLNSMSVLSGPVGLGIGGLGTLGSATLTALLSLSVGGNPAVVNLVGQEISRTFVPEPNTFGLVGLGLLALSGAGWRRTRRAEP
jgi:hypothetical protein